MNTDPIQAANPAEVAEAPLAPALYLFPVPLSDGTLHSVIPDANIAILRRVRHFAVENLRSARRFLRAADRSIPIDEISFVILDEHTAPEAVPPMIQPLLSGHPMGIISEAGCPAVADPGALLVAEAQRRSIPVIPLVGPSSILLALMASGFNGQSWAFAGYLPIDPAARRARLSEMTRRILREGQTQIFIETPYRNNRLIADLAASLSPDLLLCVASDVTGRRQSIITRPLRQWRTATYDYDKIPTIFLLHSR